MGRRPMSRPRHRPPARAGWPRCRMPSPKARTGERVRNSSLAPARKEEGMPVPPDMLTVDEAAEQLGLSPVTIRRAVMNRTITVVPLNGRTYLISRDEVERYRREHLGRRGKRKQPETLTDQERKQRAYQQAY